MERANAPVSSVDKQPSVGCVLITYSLVGIPTNLHVRKTHSAGLE